MKPSGFEWASVEFAFDFIKFAIHNFSFNWLNRRFVFWFLHRRLMPDWFLRFWSYVFFFNFLTIEIEICGQDKLFCLSTFLLAAFEHSIDSNTINYMSSVLFQCSIFESWSQPFFKNRTSDRWNEFKLNNYFRSLFQQWQNLCMFYVII